MRADPRIAITGAKNLYLQNPVYTWGKYGVLNWGPMLVRTHGRFVLDYPEGAPKDVDWVIGNGCMMSREALEKVGIFDEEFFRSTKTSTGACAPASSATASSTSTMPPSITKGRAAPT
jgi:GT2 family glycosyltransferase